MALIAARPREIGPGVRWVRFGAVGLSGFVVQLAALAALHAAAGVHPAIATALAVEAAILHNYVWHERWTWADRPAAGVLDRIRRLARFNLAAGLASIPANVALTTAWVYLLGAPVLVANGLAVATASVVTFVAAHRLVFVQGCPE